MIGEQARQRTEPTPPPKRDATSSPGGVEFGGILRLILNPVNGAGRWPCGARLRDVGGEPEVSQHALDHRRLVN